MKAFYKSVAFCAFLLAITFNAFSQEDLPTLVEKVKKSVFTIITYDSQGNELALGTGFFIDSSGVGVSNYHVFEGAKSAIIKTIDGSQFKIGKIIAQSKNYDVLKFSVECNGKKFPFLNLSVFKPKDGESVFVIGNPKGLEFSVSNGIVSSVRNSEMFGQIIQTTAPISEGNSGSPLVNMSGEVIGIISFSLVNSQNLNFAISSSSFFLLDPVNNLTFPPATVDSEKKNTKQVEETLIDVPANMARGIESVGGHLKITNFRLIFEPHSFNLQTQPFEIGINQISFVAEKFNGIQVNTKAGISYRFVVGKKKEIVSLLNKLITQ